MGVPIATSTLEKLREFASNDTQRNKVDAVIKYGSNRKAAQALGVHSTSVDKTMTGLKKQAAKRGHAPENDMTKEAPEGFSVSGTSTMYDADGEIKLQWVKTKQEAEQILERALEAAREVFSDPMMKVSKIPKPTSKMDNDLMMVYPMGDPHIGMYAWAEEAGDHFDVKIAEKNLCAAMDRLVECSKPAKQALIVNVGDFFHADNKFGTTTRGTQLDTDSRWSHVLRIGVRAMRHCIESALRKHDTVHVINEIGNHDDHTAQVLTLALTMAYEDNPRVSFDQSPGMYHYHTFGDVLIGVTHGDKTKPEKLGEIMAVDRQKDWGTTKFRYWYTGHIHNRKVFDLPGCMVESFRTLAPKDAWTAGMGYRSGRDMYSIAIHRKFGEVERHRADIIMIE
jgi:hypothetical protein